jgi:hypothetical protein
MLVQKLLFRVCLNFVFRVKNDEFSVLPSSAKLIALAIDAKINKASA